MPQRRSTLAVGNDLRTFTTPSPEEILAAQTRMRTKALSYIQRRVSDPDSPFGEDDLVGLAQYLGLDDLLPVVTGGFRDLSDRTVGQ